MKVNESCIKQTFAVTFFLSHTAGSISVQKERTANQADTGATFQILIQIATLKISIRLSVYFNIRNHLL